MKNQYSFSEILSTGIALVITKLFYKKARLIRRPIYIRGKSSLSFSEGFTTGHACRLESACQLALEKITKPSYKHLKAILMNNQDSERKFVTAPVSKGAFVRGGEYYGK